MKKNYFKINNLIRLFKEKDAYTLILLGASYGAMINMMISFMYLINSKLMTNYENHVSESYREYSLVFAFVLVVIIGPVFEELLFRGFVMKLLKRFLPFIWVNIIQAFLFGFNHFNIIQMLYAIIIGLIMGYVCHKYETLYASMLVHSGCNFMGFSLPLLYNNYLSPGINNGVILNIIVLLICLGSLATFWFTLKKVREKNFEKVEGIEVEVPEY